MNLYLRMILTLLRSWYLPKIAVGETLERRLRVLPNDLDINGHMNNGRYLTIIDLALVEYFVRTGFARVLLKQRWRPMSGGSIVSYRRGLKPLQSYTVRFRIDACDAHWNYMRFEFLESGRICAAGYMKGASVGASGLVPNSVAYEAMGLPLFAKPMPPAVSHWLAAEDNLIKKDW